MFDGTGGCRMVSAGDRVCQDGWCGGVAAQSPKNLTLKAIYEYVWQPFHASRWQQAV
jgi:hypothetical protein